MILFGMKGSKDVSQQCSSLEHDVWGDTCSENGCAIFLCDVSGEAGGVVASPYSC